MVAKGHMGIIGPVAMQMLEVVVNIVVSQATADTTIRKCAVGEADTLGATAWLGNDTRNLTCALQAAQIQMTTQWPPTYSEPLRTI